MADDHSTMLGVWIQDGRARVRDDLPRPVPQPGWALIEVALAGICGTDLQILNGYADFEGILGHEFVGTVVDGSAPWTGRRVVGEINVGCGECVECPEDARHCANRRVLGIRGLDGSFAEYVTLPETNLHPLPDHVSDRAAVWAEPLAAALQVGAQVNLRGKRCLVLGDGRLGQVTARALRALGHSVELGGRHTAKLERAARAGVPLATPDTADYDVTIECTGRVEGLQQAIDRTRPRGTVVMKTTSAAPIPVQMSATVVNEITLVGSRCGVFGPALGMLSDGVLDLDDLVDATFALTRAGEALDYAEAPDVIKVLMEPAKPLDS